MLKLYEEQRAPGILKFLTPEDCSLLFSCTETYQYSKGEHVIFREDMESEAILYLLEAGSVQVRVRKDGQSVPLVNLKVGDIIGEIGFLIGAKRTADVVAIEPSTLRFIEPDRVASVFAKEPGFAARFFYGISVTLAGRIDELNAKVSSLQKQTNSGPSIKLHIKAPTATWAQHRSFHPLQTISRTDDGIHVEFPYTEQPEMVRQVLSLGPDCEVLSPGRFRMRVASMVQQLASLYAS